MALISKKGQAFNTKKLLIAVLKNAEGISQDRMVKAYSR